MDTSISIQIIVLVILIALSGFFSSSETALTTVNKIKIRHLREAGNKSASIVEKLLDNPKDLIGSILIGNNIVNIAASAIATLLATNLTKGTPLEDTGVAISTGIMTILVLIFGEVTPKSFAQQYAEKLSLLVARPISILVFLLKPFAFLFSKISSLFIRLFGGDPNATSPFITEDELRTLVDVGEEEGIIEADEKDMLFNVFDFGDQLVKDIMVQRVDVIGLSSTTTYNELQKCIEEYQFSRIPIYQDNIDNIIGILNLKDLLLSKKYNEEDFNINDFLREPFYTFEFKKITDLLNEMRINKSHISIVLDEYGGTVGIVTLEDIVEEIVGEIDDEYDDITEEIHAISEKEYIVNGNTKIETINERFDLDINSEQFESIGGFIIENLNRIPTEGDVIEYEDFKFKVEKLNKNTIRKVKLISNLAVETVL